jgi:hypothetical protein
MVVTACSIALVLIFISIAFLHLYWAVGGRWAIDSVVPTNVQGEKVLKTSPASCLVVGTGLLVFSGYYLVQVVDIEWSLWNGLVNAMGWVIPSIFLARAIGDFRYVGFTKKIRSTIFAKLDTAYFAKLCLLIAALGYIVASLS